MIGVELREPVSALTHGLGCLLAVAGTAALWRRGGGELGRRFSLGVFGVALVVCYAGSARYHGAIGPEEHLLWLRRLDHVGIFALIAGTYTPLAWGLLDGVWRRATLMLAWGAAATGSAVLLTIGLMPAWLATTVYLAFGWGALIVCLEVVRRHPRRILRPLVLGGVFYSVAAVVNLSDGPPLAPGVGPHELSHLFVMAGSGCHYAFVLRSVGRRPEPVAIPTPYRPAFARLRRARVEQA